MSVYKITFAVEAERLTRALELLSDMARGGGASQSFVVELQPDERETQPDERTRDRPKPAQRSAIAHQKPDMRTDAGKDPQRRWQRNLRPLAAHEVIIRYLRDHGPVTHRQMKTALKANGYAPDSLSSTIARMRRMGTVRVIRTARQGQRDSLWSIEEGGNADNDRTGVQHSG